MECQCLCTPINWLIFYRINNGDWSQCIWNSLPALPLNYKQECVHYTLQMRVQCKAIRDKASDLTRWAVMDNHWYRNQWHVNPVLFDDIHSINSAMGMLKSPPYTSQQCYCCRCYHNYMDYIIRDISCYLVTRYRCGRINTPNYLIIAPQQTIFFHQPRDTILSRLSARCDATRVQPEYSTDDRLRPKIFNFFLFVPLRLWDCRSHLRRNLTERTSIGCPGRADQFPVYISLTS